MPHPTNRSEMIDVIRGVLDGRADPSKGEAYVEDIALLAEGRIDELAPERRAAVLDAVAADPELAELLAEATELLAAPVASAPRARASQPFAGRWAHIGLALAACMTLAFGTWRLVDPPAPLEVQPDGQVRILQTPHETTPEPDYWAQYEQEQLQDRARRDRYRDFALLAAVLATGMLTFGVVMAALITAIMRQRD